MLLESVGTSTMWVGFIAFVLVMLAVDLGIFHRNAHSVGVKEALTWSAVWVTLALAFSGFVWTQFGRDAGIEYLTAYLIEKSLSVDNIFVFIVIFASLKIPQAYQHRVLFWGILTALVLRAIMIFAGVALIQRFHWLMYVFGAFLIFTGVKLFVARNEEEQPANSRVTRAVSRLVPFTDQLHGSHFWAIEAGKRVGTPLLLCLLLIEVSDVVFALDSIPAIFAVTTDPFIVFTSNVFAILGLRSLFFVLAGAMEKFSYLKVGLAMILVFVGAKMTAVDFVKIPAVVSLGIIASILAGSVVASILKTRRDDDRDRHDLAGTGPSRPRTS